MLEFHGGGDGLAISQDFDFHDVAYFAAAQRIGEIVQIMNRQGSKLDQHVAALEAGFGGWGTRLDVGEFHAVGFLSKIRDGAEPRAVAAAAPTRRGASGLVFRFTVSKATRSGAESIFTATSSIKSNSFAASGRGLILSQSVGGLVVIRGAGRRKRKRTGIFFATKESRDRSPRSPL